MNTQFGPYSIRNLRPKSAKVADNGYTATLLRAGKAVATLDCGHSPDDDTLVVEFTSEPEMDFFRKAVEQLATASAEEDVPVDERFLRDLVEHTYHLGRLNVLARSSTLFRFKDDPPGTWRQVRAPFRQALADAIRGRFRHREVEFAPVH